jgi:HD-like signal output (HDOD) protein
MGKYSAMAQISIPPLASVLDDAIRLSANKNVKVDDFCSCAFQDPVLCIELLRRANSLEFGVARLAIASIPNAIMRLGWQEVHSMVSDLASLEPIDSPQKAKWIEIHRRRCRRAGMISRMIAETVSRDISQSAHMCGLFLYLGDVLAVLQLGDLYVNLAETNPRPRVNYRIATDYGFDTEEIGLDYLRITGVPNSITDVIDRNTHQKEISKHLLRPIVFSASELVESFEAGKLQRYESLEDLPNSSQLRLFKFIEARYERMFIKIRAYLMSDYDITSTTAAAAADSQNILESFPASGQDKSQKEPGAPPTEEEKIQARLAKLKSLIDKTSTLSLKSTSPQTPLPTTTEAPPPVTSTLSATPAPVPVIDAPEDSDNFGLKESTNIRQKIRSKTVFIDDETSTTKEERLTSPMLSTAARTLSLAQDSEQLMALVLTTLMQYGFEKAAIIVVSKDKSEGLVTAARGSISPGTRIELDLAFSPIAQGISKVQSTKDPTQSLSPFGSSTFALAPLKADHQTPVCLYADCGKDNTISFETRRTFRGLVGVVNTIMPRLPGGLLNEIPTEL